MSLPGNLGNTLLKFHSLIQRGCLWRSTCSLFDFNWKLEHSRMMWLTVQFIISMISEYCQFWYFVLPSLELCVSINLGIVDHRWLSLWHSTSKDFSLRRNDVFSKMANAIETSRRETGRRSIRKRRGEHRDGTVTNHSWPGSLVLLLFVVGVCRCLLASAGGPRSSGTERELGERGEPEWKMERDRRKRTECENESERERERERERDKMGQYPWVPSWPAFSIRRIIHFFPPFQARFPRRHRRQPTPFCSLSLSLSRSLACHPPPLPRSDGFFSASAASRTRSGCFSKYWSIQRRQTGHRYDTGENFLSSDVRNGSTNARKISTSTLERLIG